MSKEIPPPINPDKLKPGDKTIQFEDSSGIKKTYLCSEIESWINSLPPVQPEERERVDQIFKEMVKAVLRGPDDQHA